MNILSEKQEKGWKTIIIINTGLLIFSPAVYLFIVWNIFKSPNFDVISEPNMMVQYVITGLTIILPMIIPFAIKIFTSVQNIQLSSDPELRYVGKYQTISIIKGAIIESIYVLSLVIFFINHTVEHLWYFYLYGIFWTYIHFPRKSQYIEFIQKEQTNVVTN